MKRANGAMTNSVFDFAFDLPGIQRMYESYKVSDQWPLLENLHEVKNLDVGFVRTSASAFTWVDSTMEAINALTNGGEDVPGKGMHLLSTTWVYTDNPAGLMAILKPTFDHLKGRALRAREDKASSNANLKQFKPQRRSGKPTMSASSSNELPLPPHSGYHMNGQ